MALSQRPASRFFAAFYRWGQHSQKHQCASSSVHSRYNLPSSYTSTRNYHATRRRQQEEEAGTKAEVDGPKIHYYGMPRSKRVARTTYNKDVDDAETEGDLLRDEVRSLMRKVPSSVAIVTVANFDPIFGKNVPMGVAVSSLSTVSMDPPTISFNVKQPSKTLQAIQHAKGLFRVHFPVASHRGARMVELFCRGNHADAYDARRLNLRLYIPGLAPDADKLRATASQAPQISGDSVRAAMECTMTHEFEVGDHVIIVARIDSIESKSLDVRTILYVDSTYMVPDGLKLATHGQPAGVIKDSWSPFQYPLFPGDAERRDFLSRFTNLISRNPKFRDESKENLRVLSRMFALSPMEFGINLEQVLKDFGQGQPESTSCLSDFYGRLSPSDRASIYERAKKLVREDVRFLALNYRLFCAHLGVGNGTIDLLPSDIMQVLREAGLVGPFQPREGAPTKSKKDYSIVYLEQVEHRIKEHLATLGYDKALNTRLEDVVVSFGEMISLSTYLKRARARFLTAAWPRLFSSSQIDISGHISSEEVRVVMSRVIDFMHLEGQREKKDWDLPDILRRVGVHPSITGFDVDFFFGKLLHVYYTTRYSKHVPFAVQEMLKGWFTNEVTWADLEERVKNFVQRSPKRAMSWSTRDKLAAMGLSWDTILDVPISENNQPLNRGHILDTLVAKELKGLYGNTTEEMSGAIAQFLKEQYDFDIHLQADQHARDANSRSSHDDVQEAMLASRNVNVLAKKGHHTTSWIPDDAMTRHVASPRIRFRNEQGSRNNEGSPNAASKKQTVAEEKGPWTSYSLVGSGRVG